MHGRRAGWTGTGWTGSGDPRLNPPASFRSRRAVKAGLEAHAQIFERIDAHDAPGADEAMRRHLADSERRLVATATRQSRRLR